MKGSYDIKGDFPGFSHRDLQSIIAIYKNRDSWGLPGWSR